MEIGKIIAIGLVGTIFAVLLKKENPQQADEPSQRHTDYSENQNPRHSGKKHRKLRIFLFQQKRRGSGTATSQWC